MGANVDGKSPGAFRTISEVSTELDVPKHVLRFWESKFAQIKPMKLGGGRRYYRPEDLDLLRGIRGLLYDRGFTIKGVQKIFRENGVRYVKDFSKTEGAAARPGPVIPDVAADAAAVRNKRGAGKALAGKSDAISGATAPDDAAKLSPAHKKLLNAALKELTACRAALAGLAA
ncbi:MAG: MerR family transcriptional regulator [Hyphomicrobiales bacterium]|nr:MerR family transcriptional regulator [Hyphomicrobiales bacterium]